MAPRLAAGPKSLGRTMFTGVGTVSPQNVHLMTTRLRGAVRGGLVDGPVYERIFKSLKGVSITERTRWRNSRTPAPSITTT